MSHITRVQSNFLCKKPPANESPISPLRSPGCTQSPFGYAQGDIRAKKLIGSQLETRNKRLQTFKTPISPLRPPGCTQSPSVSLRVTFAEKSLSVPNSRLETRDSKLS